MRVVTAHKRFVLVTI